MWSIGFKALTVAVVLGFRAAAVGGTHFLCDQNHTRPIGSTSYCGSEDTFLCQAVLDASLSVECWSCPVGIPVNWTVTYTSGQRVILKTFNHTLQLPARNITAEIAGCYQCHCIVAGYLFGVNLSVTVAAGAKPNFTVQTDGWKNNVYKLHPFNRFVTLNASVSGLVVVDCSATGYPDPTYTWKVMVNGADIGDSCIRVKDSGKKLDFIPTPWNTKSQLVFSCKVQNGLKDSTITGKQHVHIDTRKWLLHPYPAQSGRVVYLTNGTATGVVAAAEYDTNYFICANMTAVAPKDNPACKFDLYMNDGKCCPCTASPCHVPLDLRMNEITVTDSEGLGLSTDGCNYTTSTEQPLLYFARRKLAHSSKPAVNQLIGITTVEKKPIPSPSPSPSASPSPPSANAFSEQILIGGSVSAGFGVTFVCISTLICVITVAVGYRLCNRNEDRHTREDRGERERRQRERLVVGYDATGVTLPLRQGENGVPTVTVQAGQDKLDLRCAAHGTAANTFKCSIRDQVIEAGKDYKLAVNCGNRTVDVSFTAAKCSSLRNRLQRLHGTLERGLHVDGKLLAQLNQHKLVTKKEFNAIDRDLQMHNTPAAGTYFVNSVLFQWPLEVFEGNVSQLAEALESHDDNGNQKIARKLRKAFSKSELHPAADVALISPNPRITPDMPSVTVHAGPDLEEHHHLQPTAHPTVPNTFECVVPEEIRFEAENEYRIVVNCGSQSVIVSFTVAKCSGTESSGGLTESGRRGKALLEQVQQKQSELTTGLHLDGTLLGQLLGCQLVTRVEFNAINARILGHNEPEAGIYFINSVLFRWSFEVFESNIRQLVKALQKHGDSGNQSVATALCEAFSECGLDVHATCMS